MPAVNITLARKEGREEGKWEIKGGNVRPSLLEAREGKTYAAHHEFRKFLLQFYTVNVR